MVSSTPWQNSGSGSYSAGGTPPPAQSGPTQAVRRVKAAHDHVSDAMSPMVSILLERWQRERTETLKGHWTNIWAAVGCLVVVALLFKPWMKVPGWDGAATVNGFGHIEATTAYIDLWSKTGGAPIPNISGMWAILTCASTLIVVSCVIYNIYAPSQIYVRVARIATVAMAFFVVMGVEHVYSKGQAVKAMLGYVPDLGGQLGLLMQGAVFHTGSLILPGIRNDRWRTASLTSWSLLTIVVAIISAMVVLATAIRQYSSESHDYESDADAPMAAEDAEPVPVSDDTAVSSGAAAGSE